MRANLLLLSALWSFPTIAHAQIATLPPGVGAYQLGTRSYQTVDSRYDNSGQRVSLAKPLDRDLAGKNLLEGAGGDQLKTLAAALADYDGGKDGLLNDLSLGSLRGEVKADVQASYLGGAYGLSKHFSIFGGVPYIRAETNASLQFIGANNALAIKDRLGGLAFDELKAGLARAAAVGVQDVTQEISNAGYNSIDHWENRGFGDLVLGTQAAWNQGIARHVRWGTGFTAKVTAPTGRADDPDSLTDVALGRGYFGFTLGTTQRLQLFRYLVTGADAAYTVNANARADRRLPEHGEALVAKDRERRVSLNPGDDADGAVVFGANGAIPSGPGVAALAKFGKARHFGDRYHGSTPGDYALLSANSDTAETFGELSVDVDTVALFQARRFLIPLVATIAYHRTLSGENTNDTAYYEATLTSFFK